MVALDVSILQAPFYLFDEIDAALDAQYRTAVARQGVVPERPGFHTGSTAKPRTDARDDLHFIVFPY